MMELFEARVPVRHFIAGCDVAVEERLKTRHIARSVRVAYLADSVVIYTGFYVWHVDFHVKSHNFIVFILVCT